MFPGVEFLTVRRLMGIFIFMVLLISSYALAQDSPLSLLKEKKDIYAILKDGQGETMEGVLRLSSDALTVQTKENQEKSIPLKYIKSITLEKTKGEIPGEETRKDATYTVRVENSQEIYTLKKKYTFSLNTTLGLVTKTIDPEMVNNIFSKEPSQAGKAENEKSFIQDKSVVFSLELKF
jgi:hypothetical protein